MKYKHQPVPCTLEDLGASVKEGADPEIIEDIQKYLSIFSKPFLNDRKEADCYKCGEILTGFGSVLMSRGGFTWGIAHGEGFCQKCHTPGRGYHFIKDRHGKEIMSMNKVLMYMPDPKKGKTDGI